MDHSKIGHFLSGFQTIIWQLDTLGSFKYQIVFLYSGDQNAGLVHYSDLHSTKLIFSSHDQNSRPKSTQLIACTKLFRVLFPSFSGLVFLSCCQISNFSLDWPWVIVHVIPQLQLIKIFKTPFRGNFNCMKGVVHMGQSPTGSLPSQPILLVMIDLSLNVTLVLTIVNWLIMVNPWNC